MATIFGTSGNDTITGTTSADSLFGSSGNDTISGGEGNDYISGGDGADSISGGRGKDTIYGGSGNDIIAVDDALDYYSLAGDDIQGEDGIDTIRAYSTSSGSLIVIRLGAISGVEYIYNTSTTKTLVIEGAGVIDLHSILAYETAGGALGQIWGSSGNDTISGFDFAAVADTISAGSGADLVKGFAGNDSILGGAGNDTINGGAGNDYLTGMTDRDLFEFAANTNEGSDMVTDFADGVDGIRLTGTGGTLTFADLVFADTTDGCVLTLAGGTIVTLRGINSASMDAGDFLFS